MGKFKSSLLSLCFAIPRSSLSISRCKSRYETDIVLSVISFNLSSVGQIRSTKSPNLELFSERTSSTTEREIKGSGQLHFVFHEKPLYKVCLAPIKEQFGEKRSTVGTHGNTFTKHNQISLRMSVAITGSHPYYFCWLAVTGPTKQNCP